MNNYQLIILIKTSKSVPRTVSVDSSFQGVNIFVLAFENGNDSAHSILFTKKQK